MQIWNGNNISKNSNCRFELIFLQQEDDTTFSVANKDSFVILKEIDLFGKVASPKINKENNC